jgi:FMN phosphatase YigB (HAD superfamily)
MENIKNIIFDYGNVIFMIDFKRTQQSFTDLGIKNAERFFAHAGHDPLFDEFEKGNISAAEFRDGVRRITENADLSDEQIDKAWNSLLLGVPPANHDLLLEIKKNYRTFLLSNINEIHLDAVVAHLKDKHRIDSNERFFEKIYYSHLVRMRKPNKDIFEHVLNDSKLKPEETLFIDDSPQHIKTAQSLGLHTHLMLPDDSLEKFLYRSGLLNNT